MCRSAAESTSTQARAVSEGRAGLSRAQMSSSTAAAAAESEFGESIDPDEPETVESAAAVDEAAAETAAEGGELPEDKEDKQE